MTHLLRHIVKTLSVAIIYSCYRYCLLVLRIPINEHCYKSKKCYLTLGYRPLQNFMQLSACKYYVASIWYSSHWKVHTSSYQLPIVFDSIEQKFAGSRYPHSNLRKYFFHFSGHLNLGLSDDKQFTVYPFTNLVTSRYKLCSSLDVESKYQLAPCSSHHSTMFSRKDGQGNSETF